MSQLRAAIVGAGGYTGAELVHWLLQHPGVAIDSLFASTGGRQFADEFPRYRGALTLGIDAIDVPSILARQVDVIFLATPHEVSASLAGPLLDSGHVVIDISGAFRLADAAKYPVHYGFAHERPGLLDEAVYGLCERNREAIAGADLIACPGCYPTSTVLPLAPLVDAGLLRSDSRPVINSISGVSGAGRSPSPRTHICEASVQPYGVLSHRHTPEIIQHARVPVVFTPHLGPYDRGILSTICASLSNGVDATQVSDVFLDAYGDDAFVRLLPAGQWPSIAHVQKTNFADIAFAVDSSTNDLIVSCAIDNLVKGASGQAIQCMNIRFGLPETLGLLPTSEACLA